MKRLFALMLALAMIFAFAACKNDTGKDDDSTTAAGADASAGDETAAPADGSTAPVTDDTGSTVPQQETRPPQRRVPRTRTRQRVARQAVRQRRLSTLPSTEARRI